MEESNWYYNNHGQPMGPMNLADLRQLFTAGSLRPETLVWHASLVQWTPANQVAGLLLNVPPPPPPEFAPYEQARGWYGPPAQSHHGLAVTAFVLSLVGLVTPIFGCLLGIAGLVLGIIALSAMSPPNNRNGHGLATAAVIIGAIACVCHCGLLAALGPAGHWHYEFHRNVQPWGWNV